MPVCCRNSDFFFLVGFEEVRKLRKEPVLEGKLLLEREEGGTSETHINARLCLDRNAQRPVGIRFTPEDAGWPDLRMIELVLSKKGYMRFLRTGMVLDSDENNPGRVLYVRDFNCV